MTGARSLRRIAVMLCLAVASTACSGDDGSEPADDQATPGSQVGATESESSTSTTSTERSSDQPEEPDVPASLLELRDEIGIDLLVLEPTTQTGSHPTLSWQPAAGAVSYWLVVRDGDGEPYWAWTGSDTSVRIGGGNTAETNQTAALHEPMTWRVAAFDADGTLIAISDAASVSP